MTNLSVGRCATYAAAVAIAGTATAQTPQPAAPVKVDSETISGLGARNIGSAAMSGRIAAVDAAWEGQRLTVYVGAASGGVWKSVNGGTTFKPVFDKQPVQSIGAITVDPKNAKVVWVGTGEPWTRNSVSIGDGIYKSGDGGDNWTNLGLKESEHIAKILVDPSETNTVYVCVPGKLWSDSDERGVYKTTDGGKSWVKILKGANASTGCSMMALDPQSPKTIFAGLWDFRRKGWTFRSGGDGPTAPSGSGLFKSTDGGASWTELADKSAKGLPTKPWGRVAVAVAPSKPNVVYAVIEAEPPKNGLYRSADGGQTWEALDRSQAMIWRPFYFANLIVDPKNENRVYKPDGNLIVSTDGGKSFSNIGGGAHGDFHDVWIDPANTDHLIIGDDGGLWYSYDAGNKWWKADNLPVSQFYHVSLDMDRPYHVYGGLQDNSSWVGESEYPGGITSSRWENMYGGDGFSPDLTTNDPEKQKQEQSGGVTVDNSSAETHTTIYAVSESPRDATVIWVGTDDGNVQVTRDGGKTWSNVVSNIAGLPKNAWVSSIEASHFDAGTVYATFDLHAFGNMRPYAYKSTDFGRTWSPLIASDSPVRGYAHVVKEDLVNKDLLFLGTEFGLWVSLDGGKLWAHYKGGDLPSVAVRDLAIHPRDHDLVIATHGRGIWIVDDITPLRALTPQTLAGSVVFMQARPTIQHVSAFGGWANGDAAFVGPNPPSDAVITYYLKKRHIFGDMRVEVFDQTGRSLGTVPSSKRRGLSRLTWSMRLKPPRVPPAASAAFGAAFGPRVLPGTYTVKMSKDKDVFTMLLRVGPDPRTNHTAEDRKAQFDLAMRLYEALGDMTFAVDRINGVRLALDEGAAKLSASDPLALRLRTASATVDELRKKIVATKEGGMITGEERLRENLTDLYGNVVFYDGRPSQTQVERTDALARQLADVVKDFDAWTAKELSGLNADLAKQRLEPIPVLTRAQWEAKNAAAQ